MTDEEIVLQYAKYGSDGSWADNQAPYWDMECALAAIAVARADERKNHIHGLLLARRFQHAECVRLVKEYTEGGYQGDPHSVWQWLLEKKP